MTFCKTLPKPLCQPTPFVGHHTAARWVRLTQSGAISLKMQLIDDMARLLAGTLKPSDHFPLTSNQCLSLIESLDAQLPPIVEPLTRQTPELQFRLLESQLYQLNQWRYWVECQLAEQMAKVNPTTIGGHIAHERIKLLYANLTDLKQRLRVPSS